MSIFFGSLFWGILLILIGASIILKGFNINFPLVKIFIAIIIILFGLKLLAGGFGVRKYSTPNHGMVHVSKGQSEYAMVFSSGEIDLRGIDDKHKDIEISAVFGNATVILPADVSFEFDATAVFGACILPDQQTTSFGNDRGIFNEEAGTRKVRIEAAAVFGRVEFRIDPSAKARPKEPIIETESTEF